MASRRRLGRRLVEVPALHLDGVDMQGGNVDAAGAQALWRQVARIGTGAAVANLIAPRPYEGNAGEGFISSHMTFAKTTAGDPSGLTCSHGAVRCVMC